MRSKARFLCTLVAALPLLSLVGTAHAQEARLRIDYVDAKDWVPQSVIKFYVDLLDSEYRVIQNLAAKDVEIRVNEEKEPLPGQIEVQQFKEAGESVAIAILMAGHNAYALVESDEDEEEGEKQPQVFYQQKTGVQNFLGKLEGADKVAVFLYDENRVTTVDTFNSQFPETSEAVGKGVKPKTESPEPGKSGEARAPQLFRNILEIIEDKFGSEEDLPRRKILLLMSDGLDFNSGHPDRIEEKIKDIVQAARDYDIKVYAIGFSPGDRENLRYLKELATKTEGMYREIDAKEMSKIPEIFASVADEIKKQYVITLKDESLDGGKPYRFHMVAKTGGRTLESEYEKDVKLDKKPFNWKSLLIWIGVGLGSILGIFLIIKVVGAILRARANRPEEVEVAQEYTGPSKGKLSVAAGPYAGSEFHLTKDMTTIGKMPGNDICLEMDDACSKRHAGVKIDEMRYEVADFGSTNGTFVNGRKVNKQFLRDGDRIRVGGTEFVFTLK